MRDMPISIIQHNCAKTYEVLTSLLHYTNGTADIILIQEPWLAPDGSPYSHPSFTCILPDTANGDRPRTAAYLSKSRHDSLCTYRSDLLPHLDGDVLPLQVLAGKEKFTLWNIYKKRKKLTPDSRPIYTMDILFLFLFLFFIYNQMGLFKVQRHTRAVRKGALRSLSWDAATPPLLSVSTVVGSMPLSMAPVPSAAKSSPPSVLLGTKTFPMPPTWASPKPPLRAQLLTQLCRPPQPGTVLVSLQLVNLPNLKPLNSFAARLHSLTSPPLFPAGTSLVLAAPSSVLAPVPTGASPLRPTTTWNFKCRQPQA